jgi:hypothetical protein
MVLRHGGVSNRPGSTFVNEVKDSTKITRLIKFRFNAEQTYVLEFGDEYVRFIRNGAYVRQAAKTITAITKANPAVVTSASHGYSNGDEVYITDVVGMLQVNNRSFKVYGVTANTFQLREMDGTTTINSTSYDTYVSGGTAEEPYEISSPYQDTDVFALNYVQSGNVITIVHPSYRPRELTRNAHDDWSLAEIIFNPTISYPTGLSVTEGAAGANTFRYTVTAIDKETYEESLPARNTSSKTITAITKADPAVVTSTAHGFVNDEEIIIQSVGGMTELNKRVFTVANVTANTFELEGIDSTSYTTYTSGGTAARAFDIITTAADPTPSAPHVITWTKVSGAREYNVYKQLNGVMGIIGVAVGNTFNDIGLTANTAITPPTSRNPFVGEGNYPSAVTYIQQRLTFANTDNDPEKIFMSRTGNFYNFTTSSPLQSDDAITFNMVGREVNEVKNLMDIGRLVIMTSGGEWSAAGAGDGPLSPTSINTKQHSYNGSGDLQPLIVSGSAIYQQARGSIVRDLGFSYEVDGYSGNDLTIFSAHLFDGYTLTSWDYQQIPHSIVWAARDDGSLVALTYVREQEVLAWHRHDFLNGFVESVVTVPEGNEDVLYLIIKRTINGSEKRYIEKFSSRSITDIVDVKIMDSSATYDGRNSDTGHTMTLSGGTTWAYDESLTLTSSASFFVAADVGNAIHLYGTDGDIIRCSITAYTSATVVTVKPHKTVPVAMRSVALNEWDRAVDEVVGLWHLEGETVSVFGDGYVVASPNNESYETVTVSNGKITLDKPYGVIHIGLPITSDLETLDIDTADGETLTNKSKNVQAVTVYVESSRGLWAGSKPPTDDDTDPLEGLREYKARSDEGYDEPIGLKTKPVQITIDGEWNDNGRVFLRQVDPVPLTILSVSPSGKFPFRGGR